MQNKLLTTYKDNHTTFYSLLQLCKRFIRTDWLISGEKQKCYIDNAKTNLDGRYALTIDIKKSMIIAYENLYINSLFRNQRLPFEILTNIVTYNSGIKMGCPTSHIRAFYAYADMFTEIHDLA